MPVRVESWRAIRKWGERIHTTNSSGLSGDFNLLSRRWHYFLACTCHADTVIYLGGWVVYLWDWERTDSSSERLHRQYSMGAHRYAYEYGIDLARSWGQKIHLSCLFVLSVCRSTFPQNFETRRWNFVENSECRKRKCSIKSSFCAGSRYFLAEIGLMFSAKMLFPFSTSNSTFHPVSSSVEDVGLSFSIKLFSSRLACTSHPRLTWALAPWNYLLFNVNNVFFLVISADRSHDDLGALVNRSLELFQWNMCRMRSLSV